MNDRRVHYTMKS